MSEAEQPPQPRRRMTTTAFVLVMLICAALAFAAVALLTSIFDRKQEAKSPWVRLVEVDDNTTDPAVWGTNWPQQFDGYRRTVDVTHTQYGGSEGTPPDSRLATDPWLKRMFAGYAFALDFRERRGHAYMLYDQQQTLRIKERPQPGACLHCHASIIPTYRRIGLEQIGKTLADAQGFDWPAVMKGFEQLSTVPYVEAYAELSKTPDGSAESRAGASETASPKVSSSSAAPTTQEALAAHAGKAHPVSCVDCHDPRSMELRVTRPGFVNGIRLLAQSDAPVPHLPSIQRWREGSRKQLYDPNVDATRQEMRSFACAQCHVEYYCGPRTTMFFPWGNGLKVEQIESFYDSTTFPDGHRFYDWVHAETGAEVLKAQHPEFETWSQGIHARSGVSCADCHMPYTRAGAAKVSDHHVRSPLLMINRSCQTCHPFPESELKARVEAIQNRTHDLMQRAGIALTDMLDAVTLAKQSGMTPQQLAPLLALQRRAQWRLDFVNAENSMGFHAPQETARVLAESIDFARQGQAAAIAARGGTTTQPAKP
ncbi:MAG: ammonia-forming cytochrome c nitrite reductase subunit c552 [Tepidisphaeraceae bacterium]